MDAAPGRDGHAAVSDTEYYCPMHPQVVRDEPGTLPDLRHAAGQAEEGREGALPEGATARVQLAPFRIAQAGIRTVEVAYAPMTETLTTVGTVEFDERRLAHIASKVRGMARVEKLYVNFTGVDVVEGQTLAELYSPELYQAIQELLLARRRRSRRPDAVAAGPVAPGRPGGDDPPGGREAQALGDDPGPGRRDPQAGQGRLQGARSSRRSAVTCSRRTSSRASTSGGQAMFEIADLHTVWVKAQVYEDEWAWSTWGRRSRRRSRRSRARRSRARSRSSSRTSTRRPARSRSATTWTTPAIGSAPGCSPR